MRLGREMGAQPDTLMGLSGMGDLVLTCTSPRSRNQSLGLALGKGERLTDIVGARASVAEGIFTAAAVMTLAEKLGIEMPCAPPWTPSSTAALTSVKSSMGCYPGRSALRPASGFFLQ